MIAVRTSVDSIDILRLLSKVAPSRVPLVARPAMREGAEHLRTALEGNTPTGKTGRMRKAWKVKPTSGPRPAATFRGVRYLAPGGMRPAAGQATPQLSFDIVNTMPYATHVEYGTRARTIRPRSARALRFYWPAVGDVVYRKYVHHPGTRAAYIVPLTLDQERGAVTNILHRRMRELFL